MKELERILLLSDVIKKTEIDIETIKQFKRDIKICIRKIQIIIKLIDEEKPIKEIKDKLLDFHKKWNKVDKQLKMYEKILLKND